MNYISGCSRNDKRIKWLYNANIIDFCVIDRLVQAPKTEAIGEIELKHPGATFFEAILRLRPSQRVGLKGIVVSKSSQFAIRPREPNHCPKGNTPFVALSCSDEMVTIKGF